MFNINDTVSYESADGTLRNGTILEVSSDMDSYEDMKLKDGTPMYWSKKTKKYVPVKEKNINSVYLAVSYGKGINVKTDYIFMNEIRELVGSNGEREAVSVT